MSDEIGALMQKVVRKTVSIEHQRQIWNCHIGIEHKQATCPLCGEQTIKSPIHRVQLECAHIVAETFTPGIEPSPLTMYPSCKTCNNACRNKCLLDHLLLTGRIDQLKRMIKSVHAVYVSLNPDLEPEKLFMHNVIDDLYGQDRYKAGGGIINDYEIRNIARAVHMKVLMEDLEHLTHKLKKRTAAIELLNSKPIGRKKPRFVG